MKANINTLKTYNWFKAMPKLMQELFIEKWNNGMESCSFARECAEEKYNDIMSMAQESN